MNVAPIVLFAYNRKEHVHRLIESLSENRLSKESDVFIFSDGYKNEKDKVKVEETRQYLNSLKESSLFRTITVEESSENKGLAQAVISGVDKVIRRYGKAIVLEDDLIVSPYFLDFMNGALDYYEADNRIWSVSGFSRDIPYLREQQCDMYFSVRAQSWSWGTWIDRWRKIDWNVSDYRRFKWDFLKRKEFNLGGNDMASMLDRQQSGKINSWAIRFCYAQFKNKAFTVQPRVTLVTNGGQDGTGTNCSYVREAGEISDVKEWTFRKFNSDEEINKELKRSRKRIPYWKLMGSYVVYAICKGKLGI